MQKHHCTAEIEHGHHKPKFGNKNRRVLWGARGSEALKPTLPLSDQTRILLRTRLISRISPQQCKELLLQTAVR